MWGGGGGARAQLFCYGSQGPRDFQTFKAGFTYVPLAEVLAEYRTYEQSDIVAIWLLQCMETLDGDFDRWTDMTQY